MHRHGQREDRDGGLGGLRVRLGPEELPRQSVWVRDTLPQVTLPSLHCGLVGGHETGGDLTTLSFPSFPTSLITVNIENNIDYDLPCFPTLQS